MISKYLSDIGLKEDDIPINFCPNDERQSKWDEQQKKYGFDERETWGLDYSIIIFIYTRLKMYNEINCINTDFHKYTYENKEYTMQECIDCILKSFEVYLKKHSWILKEEVKDFNIAWDLLGLIIYDLWW